MSEKPSQIQKKIQENVRETLKDKLRLVTISLILLSTIFYMTMLIGGSTGSVYVNEFKFDKGISDLIQRKSIKFTLLGYCIDNVCTKEVSHDFDKAPSSKEIQSGEIQKRSIHKYAIRDFNPVEIGNDVGDVAKDVGKGAEDVGKKVGDAAKDVDVEETVNEIGEKAGEIGEKAGDLVEQVAREALKKLLEAFDNFKPKESTNGISGWLAKPIIAAAVFNFVALLLLVFVDKNNATFYYSLAILLLFLSIILNLASLITTSMLFTLVFSIIGAFPGIGDNNNGPVNALSIGSLICLLVALIFTFIRCCSDVGKKAFKENNSNV
ncbi:17608_t:CDS:2 [Funneliformis geosporum]|uniref:14092_t:CDS:1 n=1 Tax=Funneliformis geosporum TaxID=1117311 RepID=A0A9W4WU64_9GLOM|nr:17608_t:CDS:2 [Funneliformis geosporum]CAI2172421.1 14092_t:CDS:2 [Funneliformis geosporum]